MATKEAIARGIAQPITVVCEQKDELIHEKYEMVATTLH
jgi:hypothetical protein